MKILAIETSCDETAISIVECSGGIKNPRFKVLAHTISSQIEIHRPFGGVVPNLAKREHLINLPLLANELTSHRANELADIDLIAVTVGPGLEPALWTGIGFAKDLAKKYKKPLIGVNHLLGHIYSFLLPSKKKTGISNDEFRISKKSFPAIALLVSGGHTILLKMDSLTKYKKIGETRDDAVGEAYDKAARLIGLQYPGGPEIERLAKSSKLTAKSYIPFPRPMMHQKNYDFSFSGLKTAVLYYLRDHASELTSQRANELRANIAASFQKAATEVLVNKTMRAAREFGAKSVFLAGGVAANKDLRKELKKHAAELGAQLFSPDFKYNTDNASMIAAAAYIDYLKIKISKLKVKKSGVIGKLKMVANGNLNL